MPWRLRLGSVLQMARLALSLLGAAGAISLLLGSAARCFVTSWILESLSQKP